MEALFQVIGYFVYAVLASLALWGAYCIVMVWWRVVQLGFANQDDQEEYLGELEEALLTKNVSGAIELCEGDRRALPQLALFVLSHHDLGLEKLRGRVAERFYQDVLADIEHRLSWVVTIIKSAPMIGLLGTVMGMMGAFANLSSGAKVDTVQMAADIQFALITTACGLAIAVPLVLCSAGINIRLSKMEDFVSTGLSRLFECLKSW